MDTPVVIGTEKPLTAVDARSIRRQVESELSVTDSERIKRARFATDPTCDTCTKAIERLEDAALISNVMGFAAHQLLIHNDCWLGTLQTMAVRSPMMRGRR